MSIINATLVAQAIHFFIAYALIKYLFFKPIFAQIEQEDALQASLITTVQSHQQTVAQKEQALSEQWHSLRNYFAAHVPVIKSLETFSSKRKQVSPSPLKSHLLQQEINSAAQVILKKVAND